MTLRSRILHLVREFFFSTENLRVKNFSETMKEKKKTKVRMRKIKKIKSLRVCDPLQVREFSPLLPWMLIILHFFYLSLDDYCNL